MNPALPDTSMKLGRYVYKHELFEIFSLANQNYSNLQDGGSKFQDGCQNKYQIRKWCSTRVIQEVMRTRASFLSPLSFFNIYYIRIMMHYRIFQIRLLF